MMSFKELNRKHGISKLEDLKAVFQTVIIKFYTSGHNKTNGVVFSKSENDSDSTSAELQNTTEAIVAAHQSFLTFPKNLKSIILQ